MKTITTYKQRVFGLDVVRAVAILLILCSHSTLLLFPNSEATSIKFVQFFGTIGVDIFFVLSGFLIGTILIKHIENKQTKPKHFLQFWIRRWLRTLPNYYLILLINIGLAILYKSEIPNQLYKYFFFLQNFFTGMPNFFTESWSLTIEEFAYLLGPIILIIFAFLFRKLNKWLFLLMTLLVIVYISLNRLIFHVSYTITPESIDWSHSLRKVVFTRLDSIYYGFLGAFMSYYYTKFWSNIKWVCFGVGGLLFFGVHFYIYKNDMNPDQFSFFFNVCYLSIVSVSILMLFPVFSTWKTKGIQLITNISLWSYSLYLINYSIVLLSLQYLIDISKTNTVQKLLILLLFWMLSFVLSYVLYTFFEKPILNYRETLSRKRYSKP